MGGVGTGLKRLRLGTAWPRCGECGHDKLLAYSCKRRGFCPSCGARRMSDRSAPGRPCDRARAGAAVGAVAADRAAVAAGIAARAGYACAAGGAARADAASAGPRWAEGCRSWGQSWALQRALETAARALEVLVSNGWNLEPLRTARC
ncbi:MAG: transposase zinc-binding domain-containing protein [Rubrivivax sp.]|nr:transposase zinc-binding domain-containing protein [Rubrivivax sp.]